MKEQIWKCRDGRNLCVGDMDHTHVINSLKMMVRKYPDLYSKYEVTTEMQTDPQKAKTALRGLLNLRKDIVRENFREVILTELRNWGDRV